MKRILYSSALVFALAVLSFASCSKVEEQINETLDEGTTIVTPTKGEIIIMATIPETMDTKVSFEQEEGGVKTAWEEGDQITIYSQNDLMDKQTFTLVAEDAGKSAGRFSGTPLSSDSGKFTIYYSGNVSGNPSYATTDAVNSKEYNGQTQSGDESTNHLFFTAMLTDVDVAYYKNFTFSSEWASSHSAHLAINGIYKFWIQVPDDVSSEKITAIRLNAQDDIFYNTNTSASRISEIGVSFSGEGISPNEGKITAYAMASAQRVSAPAKAFTVTLVGTYHSWVRYFTPDAAGSFDGGKTHVIKLNKNGWNQFDGKGINGVPFMINSADQFKMIRSLLTIGGDKRYFKFADDTDIDFDGVSYSSQEFFNAELDGNVDSGSSIIKFTANSPLFSTVGPNAEVKNLGIAASCSFTFSHPNADDKDFGPIASVLSGNLVNVTVSADVSLSAVTDVAYNTSLGGLVGCVTTGSISSSNYTGLISTPAGFTSSGKLIIGGLVGRFTSNGSISNSNFKGAINNAAQITSTDDSNPYLIIGGVVGYVDGGASVTSCETTMEHSDEESAYDGFNGKIVNKTTVAYHSALGGLVGELNNGTVSSCTNAATIAISIYRNKENCRFMKTGGIVGKNNADGEITGCTNNGSVQHRSNPIYQALGGIAGYNAGKITDCTNNAAVNHMSSGQSIKAGRYVYLGGVIGENIADNKVSDVHNTANIEISSMEDSTNSTECIGGVIGYNKGIIEGGDTKDITNSGQVYHSPNFNSQFAGYYVGGIAGLTTAAIKYAQNTGRPYFRWQNNTLGASNVHLGGIAGKAEGDSSTIENCENIVDAGITNSAQVYLYLPGTAGHNNDYVGGIVGLSEATNPVKNCANGGEVRTAAGLSTVPVMGIMMGGIIGKMTGSGDVDNADNSGRVRINFIACTESTDSHSGNYLGGIVGYIVNASSVTVTGCDNSGNVDVSNNKGLIHDLIVSGVVGRMDAPGKISDCKNNGGAINMAITAATVDMYDLYVGGILGKTEQDITITGCSNTGAISGGNSSSAAGNSFYIGGIAAYMKGACKILNCSNTGSTASTQSGNNDSIGSTTLTGGIAGYVEGTNEAQIEIGGTVGCTVNTSAAMSATRGWIGGVAAYAKYAQISNCTIESIIGGGCAARGAGGIVGKAEYCSISSSYYKGDQIKSNQIQATTGEGGIVGNLANSTIDGCYCYATKFYNNQSKPFGCIVGISGDNNTIQNCHYKSSVEGPTAGTAATAQVAGSGFFTGDGNVADL